MLTSIQKKIIFISAFVVFVIFVGFLIYSTFFKSMLIQPGGEPISTSTTSTGGLPVAGEGEEREFTDDEEPTIPDSNITDFQRLVPSEVARGGLTKTTELTNTRSADMVLSKDGKQAQFYNQNDGRFYMVDADGEVKSLSDRVFNNIEKTTWSPTRDRAILEYPDNSKIIYNFETDEQIKLPSHWEDFQFSANGSKIAMKSIGLDPSNRYLAIANNDGSQAKVIDRIGNNGDKIYPSWSPNEQVVALYTEGLDFNRQEVFFIGQNNENFKSTVVEGRGFQSTWAPDGEKLLYSVYSSDNNMKPLLWVVNSSGDNIGTDRKSLKIETWAEKCNFHSSNEVYCAVPNELQEGAGLFPELAKNTTDTLYKIDINTGARKIVAIPENDYNISNIIISDDENHLFFTDELTKKIHKINLK